MPEFLSKFSRKRCTFKIKNIMKKKLKIALTGLLCLFCIYNFKISGSYGSVLGHFEIKHSNAETRTYADKYLRTGHVTETFDDGYTPPHGCIQSYDYEAQYCTGQGPITCNEYSYNYNYEYDCSGTGGGE